MAIDAKSGISKAAVISAIFGIVSLAIFPAIPVALIAGMVALRKIKRSSGRVKGRRLAICGIVASGIAALVFAFVIVNYELGYRLYKVPTDSMSPAIKPHGRIVAGLSAYKTDTPKRGDIIVYELLDKGRRRMMCKRVVGLPGEDVEIRFGKVFVSGALTDIPGVPEGAAYVNGGDFGKPGSAVNVPEGFYYVLGDNPSRSFDSRQHGAVDRKDIKGKCVFAY